MPEEIDPFAINEQVDTEVEPSPQEDTPEVVEDTQESLEPSQDDILDSIQSVPNPVQEPSIEKESILSRIKPRGRKNRKTPPPVDGVTPYDSPAEPEVSSETTVESVQTQTIEPAQTQNSNVNPAPTLETIQTEQQQFEDIPAPVQQEVQYQEQVPYNQPEYQQSQYQQYPVEQQNVGYTNPLLTNQPLPVNYTTNNVYDPYNPYATMVDINPDLSNQGKKTDWRFIITLGAAIICLVGVIFFWIMWGSATTSLQDAAVQIRELQTKSETGQKAANQLTDLQTTIRELNTTIEELQEENDELKKNEDKIKELEKDIESLESKVKDLQNENATLSKDVDYWKEKAK